MSYPNKIKVRRKIEALTGVKSSLDKLRSVIALVYLMYVANNRKSFVRYSVSDGSKIKIEPSLLENIENLIGKKDLGNLIGQNPLIVNQYEPLYVGVTLLMKLGYLKMEGRQNTAERTGGFRYPKQLYFAANTVNLDLILRGFPDDERYSCLFEWLQNKKSTNDDFEKRLCIFLTTSTIFTQFKLRDSSNNEIYFQTEGIYSALKDGKTDVEYSDSHEFVGPTRIYNNILREDLEPWIELHKGLLKFSDIKSPLAASMGDIISTTLDIYNVNNEYYDKDSSEIDIDSNEESIQNIDEPLQQIFYGAPGTGKSYRIKKDVEEAKRIYFRTTFHPDSDYSTFVGCYKPTMNKVRGYNEEGYIENEGMTRDGENHEPETKGEIIYSFTPQAFTNAYIKAWQTDEPVFLIIEEINRGNCAQIFGDLFQLLDRDDEGKSQYKVDADKDLADYIREKLGNAHKEDTPEYIYKGEEIKLQLPNNLYIWATMNTSDQSLFPIDSAFKRRWEWVYRPIAEGEGKYEIEGQGENSWWKFIQGINEVIDTTTHSEDKKLGYYFCKPAKKDSKIITKKTFVNKVVFYLWNDVFKVYGFKSDIFDKEVSEKDTKKITFKDFYKDDGEVNDDTIKTFVKNVMAKALKDKPQTEEEDQQDQQNDTQTEV